MSDIIGVWSVVLEVKRLLQLPENRTLFLFGPRNTGKSTLIGETYVPDISIVIDLLDSDEETRFIRDPNELHKIVKALPEHVKYVVLDEIQKVPKLLDVVQRLLKDTDKFFIMTGSSARKLKQGGANLLAGRAFVYNLFPFTSIELEDNFELSHVLRWGSLPEIFKCHDDSERQHFLQAYSHTYLKEEVWGEQLVRKLDPFRRFLEVAAQCNAKIVNYANIARDVGVDNKTVQSYYSILEDTLIGFFLEPYHNSFRKRLSGKPKFYFFDTGVVRALSRLATVPLVEQTNAYGNAFEHFVILECVRLADYYQLDFRFSYLRTAGDVEIDLIVERPGKPLLCIEIKSSTNLSSVDLGSFMHITKDMPNSEAVCFCREKYAKKINHVIAMPWQQGLLEYFC